MSRKTADQWFAEYGECHQNRTNKLIHWICVPMIAASLLALLWEIPTPEVMRQVPYLNWSTLTIAVSLIFYFSLSVPLALGMFVFSASVVGGIILFQQRAAMPLWQLAIALFVLAWIGQAVGHLIEGKKPSFFADLTYLLIGPIWLLSSCYRRIGIPY